MATRKSGNVRQQQPEKEFLLYDGNTIPVRVWRFRDISIPDTDALNNKAALELAPRPETDQCFTQTAASASKR